VLCTGVLRMTAAAVPWSEVAAKLRPFVARRVDPVEVDDVVQDVLLRLHRGLGGLNDEQRFFGWMYTIARNAIAEHRRHRAPTPIGHAPDLAADDADDDHVAATALSACLSSFVARLPTPYREAITLVELEGMTINDAAVAMHISVSGMKSRVQRGRAQLREMLEDCCAIAVDARGKVTEVVPRPRSFCCSPIAAVKEQEPADHDQQAAQHTLGR
jgi:RNA polymerase sigma-70 factor (ECF subfamily)